MSRSCCCLEASVFQALMMVPASLSPAARSLARSMLHVMTSGAFRMLPREPTLFL